MVKKMINTNEHNFKIKPEPIKYLMGSLCFLPLVSSSWNSALKGIESSVPQPWEQKIKNTRNSLKSINLKTVLWADQTTKNHLVSLFLICSRWRSGWKCCWILHHASAKYTIFHFVLIPSPKLLSIPSTPPNLATKGQFSIMTSYRRA